MLKILAMVVLGATGSIAAVAAERTDPKVYATPVPGAKPVSCVIIRNIRDTKVLDDKTIDFNMRNGDILRNELPIRCPQLGFEKAFTYTTSISQLCSVDIITVLRQNAGFVRGASCGLGKFMAVAKVAAPGTRVKGAGAGRSALLDTRVRIRSSAG